MNEVLLIAAFNAGTADLFAMLYAGLLLWSRRFDG